MNIVYQSSFEEGFYDYQDKGELTCPNGWIPGWVEGEVQGVNHRPEFDFKDSHLGHPEVYKGRFAAAVMQTSATHKCCLWKQFQVEPGGKVVASGIAMIKSHRGAGHGLRMGIDPSGGTDFLGSQVKWGPWWSTYMDAWRNSNEDQWHPLEVEAQTGGTIVTVFLNSRIDFAENAAGIWGEFKLWDSGGGPVEGNEQMVEDLRGLQVGIYRQIEDLIIKYSGDE